MSDEQKEVAWDVVRACFYLLALIIIGNMLFGFWVFGVCAWGAMNGSLPVGSCKEYAPNIQEIMVGGLAVVIAFSGRGK